MYCNFNSSKLDFVKQFISLIFLILILNLYLEKSYKTIIFKSYFIYYWFLGAGEYEIQKFHIVILRSGSGY